MREPLRVRTVREFRALTFAEHEGRIRAAAVASAMRDDASLTLRQAAAAEGVRPQDVVRSLPEAFEREGRRWRATQADRAPFLMLVNSTEGVAERMVRGSNARSLIGEHHNAVAHYLATGDETVLEPFVGRRVAGVTLETDPEELETRYLRGELEFLEIYASTGEDQ
jgi:hypothetical protein